MRNREGGSEREGGREGVRNREGGREGGKGREGEEGRKESHEERGREAMLGVLELGYIFHLQLGSSQPWREYYDPADTDL